MHPTNLFYIDILLISIVPLSIFFFNREDKNKLTNASNEIKQIGQKDIKFPALEDLIQLEKVSRKDGTGIISNNLLGIWSFYSVWNQNKSYQDNIISSLLRLFSAELELQETNKKEISKSLKITNSIQFGLLSLKFKGFACLKGKQPILPFFFENIEIIFGKNILFTRSIEIPNEKDRPFFSFISLNLKDGWLAARGRGGGVALWRKKN